MINVRQLIAKIYIKLGSGFVSNATTYKMRQEASCHNCISEGKDTVTKVYTGNYDVAMDRVGVVVSLATT